MKMARRLDLLAFAQANGAILLEDDYDSDFVWAGIDVPPVFALDRTQSVVMLGTVSKSLLPGLRLGWMAVPHHLIEPVERAHRSLGCGVNLHTQAALADFIETGQFARHVRNSGRTYKARMQVLTDEVRRILGNQVSVSPPEGGLQLLLRLPPDYDDRAIAGALWKKGFHVLPASRLCIENPLRGLIVGFATADAAKSAAFAHALRGVLSENAAQAG